MDTPSRRSSVRPGSNKQPWGTILKPEFGLGHQRLSEDQIDQTVKRLHSASPRPQRSSQATAQMSSSHHQRWSLKRLGQEEIDAMLERLTKVKREKIPDSDRRLKSSIYRDMGVVSSYAWQGYNY